MTSISYYPLHFRLSPRAFLLIFALLIGASLMSLGAPAGTSTTLPNSLTPLEWNHLQSLATQAEYEFAWHSSTAQHPDGYFWAPNHAQGWQTAFTPQGTHVTPQEGAEWTWSLQLTGYGYANDIASLTGHTPNLQADKNTLTYQWNENLSEWWINTDNGLEQGFTLLERPRGSDQFSVDSNQFSVGSGQFSVDSFQSTLVLEMAIEGNLTPHLQGDTIRFTDGSGTTILTYDKLLVTDATGKAIPAHFELAHLTPDTSHLTPSLLQIHVDDSHATYPLTIDPWVQTANLTASDSAMDDIFGVSVAIDGDTVVVGAYGDDDGGDGSGSAYVFVRPGGGWMNATETAKLTASDSAAGDLFGLSVSISGDTIVIGSPFDDDAGAESGAAYVFVRPGGGWSTTTETAKLTASDAAMSDQFGYSVAISGDTIVASAQTDDDGGTDTGSAYVFVRPGGGWATATETAKLTASDTVGSEFFGHSASISDDTVVIGAPNDNVGVYTGSAYVFVRPGAGWSNMTETAKLTASDAALGDWFGRSVSVSGDTIVVGSPFDDDAGDSSGSAYVYVRPGAGWANMTETAKLTASDATAGDWFGYAVAISGDTAIIGAYLDTENGGGSGSAYVFVRPGAGWMITTETEKLLASDGMEGDLFGSAVGISGDTAVIGAPFDNNSGSAYIFEDLHPPTPTPTTTNTPIPTNTPTPTATNTPTATPVVTDVELTNVSASSTSLSFVVWLVLLGGLALLLVATWVQRIRS